MIDIPMIDGCHATFHFIASSFSPVTKNYIAKASTFFINDLVDTVALDS